MKMMPRKGVIRFCPTRLFITEATMHASLSPLLLSLQPPLDLELDSEKRELDSSPFAHYQSFAHFPSTRRVSRPRFTRARIVRSAIRDHLPCRRISTLHASQALQERRD